MIGTTVVIHQHIYFFQRSILFFLFIALLVSFDVCYQESYFWFFLYSCHFYCCINVIFKHASYIMDMLSFTIQYRVDAICVVSHIDTYVWYCRCNHVEEGKSCNASKRFWSQRIDITWITPYVCTLRVDQFIVIFSKYSPSMSYPSQENWPIACTCYIIYF